MTITLTDYLNRPVPDSPNADTCGQCGCVIQPFVTGLHKVPGGFLCDDCYFDGIGDVVEDRPIGR